MFWICIDDNKIIQNLIEKYIQDLTVMLFGQFS
jgi:hypothetical protein